MLLKLLLACVRSIMMTVIMLELIVPTCIVLLANPKAAFKTLNEMLTNAGNFIMIHD